MTFFPNLPCSIFPLIFHRTELFSVIICNDIDFLLTVIQYIFAKGGKLVSPFSHLECYVHKKFISHAYVFESEIAQHSFVR